MNIKITEKLKEFRMNQGNKQEDLAKHLGISTQAVSKWERGEGFPDISLLPSIALFYHTTVDELLGCGEIERDRKRKEYKELWLNLSQKGKTMEAIAVMRDALHEFPEDSSFMYNLLMSLDLLGSETYLDDAVELGQKILNDAKECPDWMRFSTIHHMAILYKKKGNMEKAKEYAYMLPDFYGTKEHTLADILSGDELRYVLQENIQKSLSLIDHFIISMLDSKEYSMEERIFAYETMSKLYDLFLQNEMDFALNPSYHVSLWQRIAFSYAELQNKEKTIDALCKVREFVRLQDACVTGQCNSFFTDCLTAPYGYEIFNNEFISYLDLYQKHLLNPVYDFIRDSKEWKAVLL